MTHQTPKAQQNYFCHKVIISQTYHTNGIWKTLILTSCNVVFVQHFFLHGSCLKYLYPKQYTSTKTKLSEIWFFTSTTFYPYYLSLSLLYSLLKSLLFESLKFPNPYHQQGFPLGMSPDQGDVNTGPCYGNIKWSPRWDNVGTILRNARKKFLQQHALTWNGASQIWY